MGYMSHKEGEYYILLIGYYYSTFNWSHSTSAKNMKQNKPCTQLLHIHVGQLDFVDS
jgi:hypothetical protein